MKAKKLLVSILAVVCLVFSCLALTACTSTSPSGSENANPTEIMQIYRQYVDYAKEKGEPSLSFEDWLAEIKGEQGIQGEKGDKGDQGIQGDKGDDGKSAYEIWLELGNQGTEEDFLNWLKGINDHDYGEWKAYGGEGEDCSKRMFFRVCTDCNKIEWKQGSESSHSWQVETVAPTCQAQGYDHKVCLTCGVEKDDNFTPITDHIYGETYMIDKSFHWLKCNTCTLTKDRAEHTAGEDGKCTTCGYLLTDSEGVGYDIDASGEFAVVLEYTGTATEVRIAESYKGVPVTQIYNKAFYKNQNIKSVIIPDSVTSIGISAFEGCSSLTSVVIGDSVTSIGDYTFYNCRRLTSVVMGDSVTSIGGYAFYNCSSLTSVVIGDSVTSIGSHAFSDCSSLTNVVIGDSITSIGDSAFKSCSSLTSIEVDENNKNYKSIDGVLYSKDGTTLIQYPIGKKDTSFIIPDSVTSIGDWAFSSCRSLTSVVIGDSVTSIGDYAFRYCGSLTSVEIGGSVTSIGDYAFYSCGNLTNLTLGKGIRKMGRNSNRPFTKEALYTVYEGVKYLGVEGNPYYYLVDVVSKNYSSYTIHPDTNVIINYAFYECERLASVTIPNGVTYIGDNAFSSCSSLTSVEISDLANWCQIDGLGEIVSSSRTLYLNGEELSGEIVIPNTVTEIKSYAFRYCDKITSVVIGDSVTSIDDYAFYSCSSLESVYYKGTAEEWSSVSIGSDNYYLTNATRYYYSEVEPTEAGNYWHYDENGNPIIW